MENINFKGLRDPIAVLGKELFDKITRLPKDIRPDDKERTGIQIVARQLRTRNLVKVPVYQPSEDAEFFADEKTVRTECFEDPTSQVSAYPEDMHFAGCVSYYKDPETEYHVSVSGLTAEEDTAVAIVILAVILNLPVSMIIENIEMIGNHELEGLTIEEMLPKEFFEKGHYLFDILTEYERIPE